MDRGLKQSDIDDALANPLHTTKIKTDGLGRSSYRVIGQRATVVLNPNTGKQVTVWQTSSKTAIKYGGN